VRFGLAAILWAILFKIAWSRQRSQELPREKLLIWGFGLAFVREIYMFGLTSWKIITSSGSERACNVLEPVEHSLAMIAIIVTAGAFLRYMLDDKKIPQRYIQIGVGIAALSLVYTSLSWPRQLANTPEFKFHQSWTAWLFHLPLAVLIVVAIILLRRIPGWLRNNVIAALGFYFLSEFFFLLNYSTQRAYASILCPIGNNFHIFAIPLLTLL
jgi:predicted membrane channel-forming protein YqfA (hemolysin III family)